MKIVFGLAIQCPEKNEILQRITGLPEDVSNELMIIAEEVIQTMQYPEDMDDEYIADDQLKTFDEMMGEFGDENGEFGEMEDLGEYMNDSYEPYQEMGNRNREPDGWNESPHPGDVSPADTHHYLQYIEEKDNEIMILKEEREVIEMEREELMNKVKQLTVFLGYE